MFFIWSSNQSGFSHGRSRRRVRQPARGVGHLFPAPLTDGGQLEEAAVLSRGHKFDIPEQRDSAVPSSDILQRANDQNGKLAHSNPK